MNAQQFHDYLLTLRRPTVIERLKENLPFPDGAVPKNGLPFWERIPLSKKLPIIDHPKGAFVLYRDKVGKKLWRPSPAGAFRLDDPYCLDVSYDYDPLHDGNLAFYFKSPHHRKVLRKQGLISKNDEAVCSLNQFNNYRRYLLCIYRECLKLEYNHLFEDLIDQINMQKAQACMDREMKKIKMREEREILTADIRRAREEEANEKLKMRELQQIIYEGRIVKIKHAREEDRKRRVAVSIEMDAKVKYRNTVADEIRRAKAIATMQAWRINDTERCKRMQEQQQQLEALKEKEVADRWGEKIDTQVERIVREKQILEQYEEQNNLAVQLRAKRMETQHLRMRLLFNQVKKAQSKEREQAARRKRAARQLSNINERQEDEENSSRPQGCTIGSQRRRKHDGEDDSRHRQPTHGESSNCETLSPTDPNFEYRRKIAKIIKALTATDAGRQQPFDFWKTIHENDDDDEDEDEEEDELEELLEEASEGEWAFDQRNEDETKGRRKGRGKSRRKARQEEEEMKVQMATAIDALLTNVVQEVVHRRVMYTLKYVYHEALDQCRFLVEREEKRQALKYGWMCNHTRSVGDANNEIQKLLKETGASCYDTTSGGCCGAGPSARVLAGRKPSFNPEKILKKIQAIERRNERLRAELEKGYEDVEEEDEKKSLRKLHGEDVEEEDDDETDGGRLDKNFNAFTVNLRRRIILLASQSIDERFKKFTAHRWKIMKDVELVELMERLCNMMLMYDSKEFLTSGEFQWAADILARDIMKEVRAQIRSEKRDRILRQREEIERHREGKQTLRRHRAKTPKLTTPPSKEAIPTVLQAPEAVCPDDVPLLRLHNRSPHQPSLPSITSEDQ